MCPLCRLHRSQVIGRNPDFPQLLVVQCKCGMRYSDPAPSEAYLQERYRSAYRQERGEYADESYLEFMRRRAVAQLDFVRRVRPASPGSVLDVGCSSGMLLQENAAADELVGFEPDEEMCKTARRILPGHASIRNSLFQPGEFSENRFDLITISHVLEHVVDPVGTVSELVRLLKPGGVLFIEVPHESDATVRHLVNSRPAGFMHLLFFSADSLQAVVERAGGAVLSAACFGPSRSGATRQTPVDLAKKVVKRALPFLTKRMHAHHRKHARFDVENQDGIWLRACVGK